MSVRSRVRVPASTANLGPGFDALGLALAVYLDVEVVREAVSEVRIAGAGVDAAKMPTGSDNLIVRVMDRVAEKRGRRLPAATLKATNQIPLARGMGSSATAIIAGISCYEILSGEEFSPREIFDLAFEFESHPDNLAAALYGGLTVSATRPDGMPLVCRVAVAEGLRPVLVIPEFELSTEKARSVLPDSYSRTDTIFNVQRSALVVAAMTGGRWDLLSDAMQDRIHQPYRAPLIPGLEQVLSLRADGLVSVALSGAGPTVLALALADCAESAGERIRAVFEGHGVASSVRVSDIDSGGRVFG
jgi:homoserine kinase